MSTVSARDPFFANHVVNVWNSLSGYVVTAPTVSCLKRRLISAHDIVNELLL